MPDQEKARGYLEMLRAQGGQEKPRFSDFSRHLEANTTGSIINMIDQWIAIEGDTNSGIHECLAYTDLSEMQMLIYATALLMSYETTDSARSTSKSYHIVLKYGEDDDDLYVIDSQDKADAIVEIIQSAMGSDE